MEKDSWAEAAQLLSSHPEIVAHSYELSWDLGWCHFKLSQFDQAVTNLRRAVEIDPGEPGGYWALATALVESGDFETAEAAFLKAIAVRDGYLSRAGLAMLYLQLGRTDEAERVHLEGIQLKPESRERLESYGDFLWDVRREEEARAAYSKAEGLWYESRKRVT